MVVSPTARSPVSAVVDVDDDLAAGLRCPAALGQLVEPEVLVVDPVEAERGWTFSADGFAVTPDDLGHAGDLGGGVGDTVDLEHVVDHRPVDQSDLPAHLGVDLVLASDDGVDSCRWLR